MRTFVGKTCRIHHNGDYSVSITIKTEDAEVHIDNEDIIYFVIQYLKDKKISEIEDMDTDDFIRTFV